MINADSHHSTLRERIVEHLFVGEALRTLWRLGVYDPTRSGTQRGTAPK
ncbi:MAG: hypothetical protein Q8L48_32285 [Archangium sp.]|nr:hypothetical protein [Archangium sp.]